jgi:hypothetical protein
MHGCQGCQDKLLEHLYDLLDEAEQQELSAHLAGCPACQAAQEKVRAQQKLLAAAARLQFPTVQFTPPAAEPPAPEAGSAGASPSREPALGTVRPVLLPVRPRLRRPVAWKRWAVAASVLLLLAGLGVSAGLGRRDYCAAQQVVRKQQDTLDEACAELRLTQKELLAAATLRDRRIDEVRQAVRARQLRMEVQGPHSVQPGVAADFLVRTYDLNGQPAAAEVAARLDSQARGLAGLGAKADDREAAAARDLRVRKVQNGVYSVSIPPTQHLDLGKQLNMVVEARRKAPGGDRPLLTLQGSMRLTAPVYLTHLATDKPMYQPGEVVRFRSLTVDRTTLAPATEDFRFHYTLTAPTGHVRSVLRGGNGLLRTDHRNQVIEVPGPDGKPIRGVGAGEVALEADAPGGEWVLTVSEERGRFTPTTRRFLVNRYQKPHLDKKLDFNKPSYGPGDDVQARVSARRADGGPVKDRPVEITVLVDGQQFGAGGVVASAPFGGRTDANGQVLVRFRLPAQIERGQASLAVKFLDDGAVDTIVRPIPIVLKKLKLEFFPEGGDLVAGLSNRVYFQARTPLGKPAQVVASLVEDGQVLPGQVETLADDRLPGVNQGNGVFTFTPRPGRRYELRIDSPAGIATRYPLPAARADGVVLSVPGGVFEAGEPIRAQVNSTRPRPLLVGAYCRGRLLTTARVEKDQTEVVLDLEDGAGGVCRITVFEELPTDRTQRELVPVAERLVYRHPRERADVAIATDRRSYVPGQKANVALWVTNEKEKLTPAVLMVAVVDRSVVTLADAKTDRGMPAELLLCSEVRRPEDLEYADFLIGQNPRAPQALDLLLGTQGWRRFAEAATNKFFQRLEREGEQLADGDRTRQLEEAGRLLVLMGQSTPRTTDPDQEQIDRALEVFHTSAGRLQARHDEAQKAVEQADEAPAYRAAVARLGWYRDLIQRGRAVTVPLLAVLALVGLLAALWQAAARRLGGTAVAGGMAAALAALLLLVWRGPILPPPLALQDRDDEVAQFEVPPPAHLRAWERAQPAAAAAIPSEAKDHAMKMPTVSPNTAPPPAPTGPTAAAASRRREAAPKLARGEEDNMPKTKKKNFTPTRGMVTPSAAKSVASGGLMRQPPVAQVKRDPGTAGRPAAVPMYKMGRGGFGYDKPKGELGTPGKDRDKDEQGNPGMALKLQDEALRFRYAGQRDGKEAAGKGSAMPSLPPLMVREYAHHHATAVGNAVRSDFAETVYWHPVLVLPDGKAVVSFDLCDSLTSFEVTAFAHTPDGRLGAATKRFESRLPFTLAPKVPVEVTATDRVDVTLGVANNTPEGRPVQLRLAAHDGLALLEGAREPKLELPAHARVRRVFSFRPTLVEGTAKVRFEGTCAPFTDAVEETFRVVPDGFPVAGSSSDLLERSATHKVRLPDAWVPGTLHVQVDVYPSTLADLQKGLESLLREPHGCFEQSSTANYPNVLILDYLRTSDQSSPEQERKVRELLDRGYRKLTSFECKDPATSRQRGYEWFGGTAPPHEALTAYGLLQFRDMARVHDVDPAMLKRTRDYLLGQRDGQGGFRRNPRAIDTFGRASEPITSAYIVWALTEGDKDEDVAAELNALLGQAKTSDDPYFLSLVALGLTNRGRQGEAEELLRRVARKQQDGRLEAARTSITGSGGRDLTIETTALAVLAWLKTNPVAFDAPIRAAVKWIGQQRGAYGGFGSTQSTILALKALIAHAKANKRVPEAGELRLFVGETKVAQRRFPAGVNHPLTLALPAPEKHLKPGENRLRVEITGANNIFPHTLAWTYRTPKPASAARVPVTLQTSLAQRELEEGDTVRLQVKVQNTSGAGQGMAVAVVGLPAGLSLPEDLKQLKEYCRLPEDGKRPLVSAFEVRGRELVLYWRDLAKDQEVEVPIDLVARVPGVYRGPASRAYLYYNADVRHWVEPLAVTVKAKQ